MFWIKAKKGVRENFWALLKFFDKIPNDAFQVLGLEEEALEAIVEGRPELGMKVTRAGERALMSHFGGAVWLTHMRHHGVPFYQAYDDEERQIAKCADLLLGEQSITEFG